MTEKHTPEKIKDFTKEYLKNVADFKPGDTVKVYQKVPASASVATKKKKEAEKERIQVFEGVVLARKHGKGVSATFTVRKMVGSVGVERIFPLHSPNIEKIEVVSRGKVRRAKLYYLRERVGKKAKVKRKTTPATLNPATNKKTE